MRRVPATRVLLVDDSAIVRRQVAGWIAEDESVELAGSAASGRQAIERFEKDKPDVVVLDIEMPGMDGIETLRAIRERDKRVPVLMFSTLTTRGATATLDALGAGATDYVTKPTSLAAGGQGGLAETRAQLLEKIKHLRPAFTLASRDSMDAVEPAAPTLRRARASARVDAVVIGTSTGGPNLLTRLLPQFPAELPVPLLIVQHMPPVFTQYLAERLSRASKVKVMEAVDGRDVGPGEAWIAPGGHHLELERRGDAVTMRIHDGPPEHNCRPSVNVLFRSAAQAYGPHVLGVMLTGMGQDGLEGSQELVAAGGEILAQDAQSAVVWSMPGAVARAGLASAICTPDELVPAILRRVERGAR